MNAAAPTSTVKLTQDQLRIILAALDDYEQTTTDNGGDATPVSAVYDILDSEISR